MRTFLLSSLLLALAACANAAPAQDAPLQTTVRMQPPLKVTWEERARTDTSAELVMKVERLNRLDMTFQLQAVLPAGVKVVAGRTQLTLLPNVEAVTIEEPLTLAFEATPADDAILELDGDSGAMGFHYRVRYRFGRAAPEERGPAATGPEPTKGGKRFGPSVQLQ